MIFNKNISNSIKIKCIYGFIIVIGFFILLDIFIPKNKEGYTEGLSGKNVDFCDEVDTEKACERAKIKRVNKKGKKKKVRGCIWEHDKCDIACEYLDETDCNKNNLENSRCYWSINNSICKVNEPEKRERAKDI